MRYDELRNFYADNFSLGNLATDIKNKFALISLICYIVHNMKAKKPDVSYYQVIYKIDPQLPEEFIKALAIICEDFSYGCTNFPTFELKSNKEIISTIKDILSTYLPF